MSKHRNPEWKAKSKRNRHNGNVNKFKRNIITHGEHFEIQGKNYFMKVMRQVRFGQFLKDNICIVSADRRV